jgi:hypothetical protein
MNIHNIEVEVTQAITGWRIWIPALIQASRGHSFRAVVDDFGNLVIVP